MRAKPVVRARGSRRPLDTRLASRLLPALGAAFLCAVAVLAAIEKLHPYVAIGYAVISAITFLAYRVDKAAAQQGRWRTRESSLHLMSLLGGWPGALAAQQLLRHKSSKGSFQMLFWLSVVANLLGLFWLL